MGVDPITFEVFRNGLVAVAEQMSAIIWRTSFSTIIREMLDYSTAIFDPAGRIVAQACRIPIHLNSMSRSLRTALVTIDTWRPGDIVVMNDPYSGGQHLPDVQTFMPVFVDDALVAICGTLGHHLDVGGMRPGSYAADATEIYQEGLRLPPIKLAENGRMNDRLLALIAANIRQPDKTLGDLRAQTAALEVGAASVRDIVQRYGAPAFREYSDETVATSERRMRACLAAMPRGTYAAEACLDDDGVSDEPVRVAVAVTVGDGEVTVDFTGSSRQRPSPINATISSTESATYYVVMAVADPTIPANFGCYEPIRVIAPSGTVVNAELPSPVVGRMAITHTITNALFAAFASALPGRVTAAYYGMSNVHVLSGDHGAGGQRWIFVDIEVGGWGARAGKDGLDCYSQGVHNLANTPIEMVEAVYPLRFTQYELVPDSGGAGAFRGGLGAARDIELLDERGALYTQFDHCKIPAFGLFGGRPGACADLSVESGGRSTRLPSKVSNHPLRRGDVFRMTTQGGGGYGEPRERDPALIERDLREGKVTPAAVTREYGR
ncbi:MAG: hydantoinase B/oxoprolinase family protein [Candidatus Rokubacteria bacterium]|nr:hydantoinase B/oxoprolinase family protein [Candidatus Rokubacteria bacterium]